MHQIRRESRGKRIFSHRAGGAKITISTPFWDRAASSKSLHARERPFPRHTLLNRRPESNPRSSGFPACPSSLSSPNISDGFLNNPGDGMSRRKARIAQGLETFERRGATEWGRESPGEHRSLSMQLKADAPNTATESPEPASHPEIDAFLGANAIMLPRAADASTGRALVPEVHAEL
jgi:hypothetical protein